jgi:flagellar protein FliS
MEPAQLMLILYKEAIKRLNLTKKALLENDTVRKGENLGRAIAIISELNSCISTESKTDEILFLRGLYSSMLRELLKVNVTKEVSTLDTALRYIERLKEIWENDVIGGGATQKDTPRLRSVEYA